MERRIGCGNLLCSLLPVESRLELEGQAADGSGAGHRDETELVVAVGVRMAIRLADGRIYPSGGGHMGVEYVVDIKAEGDFPQEATEFDWIAEADTRQGICREGAILVLRVVKVLAAHEGCVPSGLDSFDLDYGESVDDGGRGERQRRVVIVDLPYAGLLVAPVFHNLVKVLDLVGAEGCIGLKGQPLGDIHPCGKLNSGAIGVLDVGGKVLTDVALHSGLHKLVHIVHVVEVRRSAENGTGILVTQFVIIDVLRLRERIVVVVREIIALRLTVAHSQRGIGSMVANPIADTHFRIKEIVGLVDVQTLILVGTVLLLDELVVDAIRCVAHVPVLKVSECRKMLSELLGSLDKTTVIILSGIRVIILVTAVVEVSVVQTGKSRIMIDNVRVRDISEITEMVAPEHLAGKSSDDIPSVVVVTDVIDKPGSILRQAFLTDEIGCYRFPVRFYHVKTELGDLAARFELIIVAISVSVMKGQCGLQALVDVPRSGKDVMVLPEVVRSLRPVAAVVQSVAGCLVSVRIH